MQSLVQYRRIQAQFRHTSATQQAPNGTNDTPKSRIAQIQDPEKPLENIIVTFDGPFDPLNPQNWHWFTKVYCVLIICLIAFIVCAASSIDAPVIPQAAAHFHVSNVVESLATAIFLVGFGVGALFAGPLSEAFGRSPIYLLTFSLFCIWVLASALAPSIGPQITFRFLAGFFGSTPFTTLGGTLADLYDHTTRAKLFPFFASIAFVGVNAGPLIGGYVGRCGMPWRWTEWITLCISGFVLVLVVLLLPETYAPVILTWKAQALRIVTGDPRYKSSLEATNVTLSGKMRTALSRPFIILVSEPIVVLFTLYMTVLYVISFSFFASFPFIFGSPETYNFSQGSTYLVFLAIITGVLVCALVTPLFGLLIKAEAVKAAKSGHDHPPPEAMLWWAIIAAPLLPISLFWLAWTTYKSVSYWSAIIACGFFGFSQLSIFISTYAYIMQTFGPYSVSALVSNVFVRYVAGGSLVVVAIPMYTNLGVHHALTVLASIACAVTPVPYVFYVYGSRIRGMSRWVPQ